VTKTFQVEGITCQGCLQIIGDTLAQIPGIRLNPVSGSPPQATVELNNPGDVNKVNQVLAHKGAYRLVEPHQETHQEKAATYYPLVLILGLILSVVALEQWHLGSFQPQILLRHFMGGFFLVFGFFKLLDLKGFSQAYQRYDLLATQIPQYGLLYPFIEVLLGFYYLSPLQSIAVLWFTLGLMLFSSLGVIRSLSSGAKIQCACLGTVFNLPMTMVTLLEDLWMVAMSVYMLLSF